MHVYYGKLLNGKARDPTGYPASKLRNEEHYYPLFYKCILDSTKSVNGTGTMAVFGTCKQFFSATPVPARRDD